MQYIAKQNKRKISIFLAESLDTLTMLGIVARQNIDETLIRNSEIATNYTRFRNLRFGMAAIEAGWGRSRGVKTRSEN